MLCPRCSRENPQGSKFCLDCGAPLSSACSRCGHELPPGSRFCNACGTPVEQPSQPVVVDRPLTPPATQMRATPQPASFANGRYQVKEFLGEGGKKKVYLAHDTLLDREVAFALIKTEGLDESGRSRIQREAQAMGRLGSHPHIVTVFDLGEEQDQPYMVTELMGGGDVKGLINDADGHRLPLEQAIGIAVETCRGLEFAHNRGIVHRDLKPGGCLQPKERFWESTTVNMKGPARPWSIV